MVYLTENTYGTQINGSCLEIHYLPQYNTQYISVELPFGGLSKYLLKGNTVINIKPGSAHLLEHISLDTYNSKFFSIFMNMGARCNGYTHLASTIFNLEMIDLNFNVLNSFLEHILEKDVDNELLERQREIISSEINSRRAFPATVTFGLKKILGDEYNYFTVIGEYHDIQMIRKEDLIPLKKYIYNPNQMNLITFGPKDPSDIITWFKSFMSLNNELPLNSSINIQRILRDNKKTEGIIVSNEANEIAIILKDEIKNNQEMIKKEVLMNFFIELHLEDPIQINRGSNIRSHIDYFNKLGITVFIINGSKKEISEISKMFTTDPKSIMNSNMGCKSLQCIKNKMLGRIVGMFDYPDKICNHLHWLFRNSCSLEDYITVIQSITIEEIYDYVDYLFSCIREHVVTTNAHYFN